MTNRIIEAIATLLGELFPECHCYIQDVKQGLEEPCFIIKLVSSSQRERLGDRVMLDELYSVTYLSCDGDTRRLMDVTELAELSLRFIDVEDDGPMMTRDRNTVIVDDTSSVITFGVTRTVWFERIDPLQMKLLHTTEVRNG